MIKFKNIGTAEIQLIAAYLLQNKNNIAEVVSNFGDIVIDNGYGTLFLNPKDRIFKVISIFVIDGQISSLGLGGADFELSLENLYFIYPNVKEGYIPYDGDYIYVFYSSSDFDYTIKITSKIKLFESGKIVNNININEFVITLK